MKKAYAVVICMVLVIMLASNIAIADTEYGVWTVMRYIDQFGEPTGDYYAINTNIISGTFSNLAVTNNKAYMAIIVDYALTRIQLYEYKTSSGPIWNSGTTSKEYTIQLTGDGYTNTFSGTMYPGTEHIVIDNQFLFDALLANYSKVSIYIATNNSSWPSTYLFSNISTTGFLDAATKVYGTKPVINVSYNMNEPELNKQFDAVYRITKGHSINRVIIYQWELFDGNDWSIVDSGELTSSSGTISYTPTSGTALYLFIYVWDSSKIQQTYDDTIYMKATWLSLPAGIKEIESGAFSNIGNIVHAGRSAGRAGRWNIAYAIPHLYKYGRNEGSR